MPGKSFLCTPVVRFSPHLGCDTETYTKSLLPKRIRGITNLARKGIYPTIIPCRPRCYVSGLTLDCQRSGPVGSWWLGGIIEGKLNSCLARNNCGLQASRKRKPVFKI
jgi:hypothetical protein